MHGELITMPIYLKNCLKQRCQAHGDNSYHI